MPGDTSSDLWRAAERLVERAPLLTDLQSHKLELVAARKWREEGRSVPEALLEEERRARVASLATRPLLERVFAAYGRPFVVLKGPAVAAAYPDPVLRSYNDLDLLVEDAGGAWRALVLAGFEPIGDPDLYVGIHHLRPLAFPGLPLAVEIHSQPKWVAGLEPPTVEQLFAAATASDLGDGALVLPPEHHALVLAAHSWAHEPLRRLRDLLDIAVVVDAAPAGSVHRLAREWGVQRLWRTTAAAAGVLFDGGRTPWALRLWAQNLIKVRERTVVENHAQRWLSGLWVLPPGRAVAELLATVVGEVGPGPGETWRAKVQRTGLAIRNAFVRRSEHDRRLP
jgi:hypothetical protein